MNFGPLLITLVCSSIPAQAIRCYICNSFENPDCEDLQNGEQFEADCNTVWPNYGTMCRKVVQEVGGNKTIIRTCGFVKKNSEVVNWPDSDSPRYEGAGSDADVPEEESDTQNARQVWNSWQNKFVGGQERQYQGQEKQGYGHEERQQGQDWQGTRRRRQEEQDERPSDSQEPFCNTFVKVKTYRRVCTCFEDLCNGSSSLGTASILLPLALVFLMRRFN